MNHDTNRANNTFGLPNLGEMVLARKAKGHSVFGTKLMKWILIKFAAIIS